MWSSPLFWLVFAIALFWALGAYNRLMRLRSAVVQAFGGLDAHVVRQLALLGEFGAAHSTRCGSESCPGDHAIMALQGAMTQLSASLAVARARPLQVDAVAGLATARGVLQASWQEAIHRAEQISVRSEAYAAGETAAAALAVVNTEASVWQLRWNEHSLHIEQAVSLFNDAVLQYNAAIAQFPARLLAWVFGFKAARML